MTLPQHLATLSQRLDTLNQQIVTLAAAVKRDPKTIKLVAVSKGQSIAAIETLAQAGQRVFGENYLQEALPKIAALAQWELEWHFIGQLQRNKAKAIAQHFHWVHSVDNLAIAEALNRARPLASSPLLICLQVNLAHTPNQAGLPITQVAALAHQISHLPQLELRGLMTLLPQNDSDTLKHFQNLATLLTELNQSGLNLDTLSMGMSHDYPAAITAGATMLRIGTALFGPRQ